MVIRGCFEFDDLSLREQDEDGEGEIDAQLDGVVELLEPMLRELPAVLAAKARLDVTSEDAPDIFDLDRLLGYVTREWQLVEVMLEGIPRAHWPDDAIALQQAVDDVNATLHRPLPIDL